MFVTDDAAAVKAYLEADEPSPMTYNAEVSDEVKATDETIVGIEVKPTAIDIVPVGEMFEGGMAAKPATGDGGEAHVE